MRIATFLPWLETAGGVELHVLEATRELARRGHQISLHYERDGNLSVEFGAFCETLLRGPSPLYSSSPIADAPRVTSRAVAARRPRPDLVYANNVSELAWATGIRFLTGASIVCHMHEFRPFRRTSLSVLGSQVDQFVVASRFMRDTWERQGVDPGRVEVIPYGFDLEAYPPGSTEEGLLSRGAMGLPADAYVVLCMGRIIPEKGVDVLLEAWRRLALPSDRARLVIVGVPGTPDQYVQRLQADAPPGCDWVPFQRNVIGALHAADVLVLPSMWEEPFGRVTLEAMATGRPTVASAVGGIPEVLDGEFTRMLFPRGDAAALAERLSGLANWRAADPDLARRCIEHVEQRYLLADTVSRLEGLFAELTTGRRSRLRRA